MTVIVLQDNASDGRNAIPPTSISGRRLVPAKNQFSSEDPNKECNYVPSIKSHDSKHATMTTCVSLRSLISEKSLDTYTR